MYNNLFHPVNFQNVKITTSEKPLLRCVRVFFFYKIKGIFTNEIGKLQ